MCKEKKSVCIQLHPDLIEKIREQAENNERTFSNEIAFILKSALKNDADKNPAYPS